MLGEGLREEKEKKNDSFTLLDIFVTCNTCPGKIWLTRASKSSLNSLGQNLARLGEMI